jgi:hypothetical protein
MIFLFSSGLDALPQNLLCSLSTMLNFLVSQSHSLARELDALWLKMRNFNTDVPASNLLIKDQPAEAFTSYALNFLMYWYIIC